MNGPGFGVDSITIEIDMLNLLFDGDDGQLRSEENKRSRLWSSGKMKLCN